MSSVSTRNSESISDLQNLFCFLPKFLLLKFLCAQVRDLPTFGIGHSLGSLVHLLIGITRSFSVIALLGMLEFGLQHLIRLLT